MVDDWTEEQKKAFPSAYQYFLENPDVLDEDQFFATDDEQGDDEEVDPSASTMAVLLNRPRGTANGDGTAPPAV